MLTVSTAPEGNKTTPSQPTEIDRSIHGGASGIDQALIKC